MTDNVPLAGKIALVTGSSRGIGRAIALQLAGEGADVLVGYRLNAEAAKATAAEIEQLGRRARVVQANIAEPAEVEAMMAAAIETFGGLDILVCNAATGKPGNLASLNPKAFHLAFSVNAVGTFLCVQAAAPYMVVRGRGRVVVLVSPGANRTFPGYMAVGASKAAVSALVKYLAVELAPQGIVVNAVSPGICETEALRNYVGQAASDGYAARTPMGRSVTPEEVAVLVSFLCREETAMICGQTISIDGGYFLPF